LPTTADGAHLYSLDKRHRVKNDETIGVRLRGAVATPELGPSSIIEDILERKYLQDQLERERDRLRFLLDINHQFISKLEIGDFFSAAANGLRQLEGWERATITVPEPSTNSLRIYLHAGSAVLQDIVGPLEGTVSGKVCKSREPLIFHVQELPTASIRFANSVWGQDTVNSDLAALKVGCALPLIQDGRVLGVLILATRRDMESATRDLSFLQELAKLIAASLSNALRYDQVNASHLRLLNEKNYIEDQIRTELSLEKIIGESAALKSVLQQVNAVAPTDSTVLVLGETGTGKELIARAIHDRSKRRDRSFIKVDCSTIPNSLMESELFGHEKGAFTGASTQKLGRFEIANDGTLFLDEVGDVPLELQSKLLRVVQEHAFERLGSNRTRHLDLRIIAATNRNLAKMVEEGKFREDLFYRLKVFPITIPPLRERPEDIPELVQYYASKYAQRMRRPIGTIPQNTLDVLVRYPWPGNVRELQHFIERSVILSSGGILQVPLPELKPVVPPQLTTFESAARSRTLEDIERESVLKALGESNWVVGGLHGAAAKLGLKRTTLVSRMEKLGISRSRQQNGTELPRL
jgi:formate hydrogenlyase transcriptional activator